PKNKATASYFYNTTNASVLSVYDNYLHTGFRSFHKGMGDFNQLDNSSLNFSYELGNWTDRFHANFYSSYTENYDFLSTNTLISQNYSQSESILIKDRKTLALGT